nr:MAG: VRR-NUC domain [Bacteriophage sp.]
MTNSEKVSVYAELFVNTFKATHRLKGEIIEMKEASIEKFLKERIEANGGVCLKFNSTSMRGVPDRICMLPNGRIFFVELKAPGKTARPEQLRAHRLFKNLGQRVYVCDSRSSVCEVIINEVCTA